MSKVADVYAGARTHREHEYFSSRNDVARAFHTTEDFRNRTFLDAFADVFTDPADLPLHQPDHGYLARVRDAHRIREYFRQSMGAEKARQDAHDTTD